MIVRRRVVTGLPRPLGATAEAVELALYRAESAAERNALTLAGHAEREVRIDGADWLVDADLGEGSFPLSPAIPAQA